MELSNFIVTEAEQGQRLDVFLANKLTSLSRVRIHEAIQAKGVLVDGQRVKVAYRLHSGQRIQVTIPPSQRKSPIPEPIPLDILYEDDWLVAINKPSGMIVHPAKGHRSGTLVGALAHYFQRLSTIGGPHRPGIVHRLDRETSGVIVVAKSDASHLALASQFEQRTANKEYFAILQGCPDRDRDVIDQPIGLHPRQREKMAIREGHPTSRDARTAYEVTGRFGRFSTVAVRPRTGRTHQIRVHMTHIGCPVLCDRLYGGRSSITRCEISGTEDVTVLLDRLALHARRLALVHPGSNELIQFEAPLPRDLREVVEHLTEGWTN